MDNNIDIRWKQRLDNFSRAYQNLSNAMQLANERKLSDLEEQGLIQGFEYTHELAWKVLKDYLEEQGFAGIIGSKNATRIAFREGLINNGEVWMEMIEARNETSHTYNLEIAQAISNKIRMLFYPEFVIFIERFMKLYKE
ncbi:MAG: nucleotidyltransferase substrate binding protein [Pseudomonadota bacterium]